MNNQKSQETNDTDGDLTLNNEINEQLETDILHIEDIPEDQILD